ncbi:MAG: carbohydrate-binding domain-containing protein [Lactimicrobium sp.]|jgi:hypothetical protein|uniref:carbohydrate-binding domain-containing protein n=1 Tax=Lactimicrobium sp. TaxID=2563780 RepID=UPI002F35C4C5
MNRKKIVILSAAGLLAGCTSVSTASSTAASGIQADIVLSDDGCSTTASAGVAIAGSVITISMPGTYTISGSLQDGQLIVNTASKGEVVLVLDGISLTSSSGPAIIVSQADETVITASEDSENDIVSSGTDSDGHDAAVYSKDDLTFNGSGTLTISGGGDAIHGNDSISISEVTLNLNAGDDGIQGHELVEADNAVITVDAGSDGIKAGNDEGEGTITLNDDTVTITADDDGIQAEKDLDINSSTLTVSAGTNLSLMSSSDDEDASSSHGLKADGDIAVSDSALHLNASDDAVHAAGSITLDSDLEIACGDDGVHSDTDLTINGGTINITSSYEGLEAENLTITDGTINIVSSDDGINTSSGTSNDMQADDSWLSIEGGTVVIDAGGDGIDLNGSGEMTGGSVTVYGPQDDGNGAIDYAGTFTVSSGTLIAGGSSGMLQVPSDSSSLATIVAGVTSNGEDIVVKDASGNEILRYASTKTYAAVSFTSDALETGSTYSVYQGDDLIGSLTLASGENTVGTINSRNMGGGSPGGGMPGNMPDQNQSSDSSGV